MYTAGHGQVNSLLFQWAVSILWMLVIFKSEYVRLMFDKIVKNIFTDMVDIIISWA
jgi:hypothetical protein